MTQVNNGPIGSTYKLCAISIRIDKGFRFGLCFSVYFKNSNFADPGAQKSFSRAGHLTTID